METASEALAAGQLDDALECYAAALAQEPDSVAAQAGLAQCHLARGDSAAAAAILDAAPPHDNDPALASARAAVALAQKIAEKMPINKAAKMPMLPCWRRLKLTQIITKRGLIWPLAHHGAGRREAALDALLDIVARQRDWNEEAARKQLLEFFDAYGAQDAQVIAARKRLSSLLFS